MDEKAKNSLTIEEHDWGVFIANEETAISIVPDEDDPAATDRAVADVIGQLAFGNIPGYLVRATPQFTERDHFGPGSAFA